MKAAISVHEARMRAPLVSSRDSVSVRPLILLRLRDKRDGLAGFGEAAPLHGYDGVDDAQVIAALDACGPLLASSDGRDREALLAQCAELAPLPQALAAIDLALWDLAGRRAGEPIWRLLGAVAPVPVEVNATIGALDPEDAAREVRAAVAAGFRTLKVKVAAGDDSGRIAAARAAAGNDVRIRIDANGGWSAPEAIAALRALAPHGIECCEEPVHGLEAIAAVAGAAGVPVSLDESAAAPGALARRVCDAACLKISRCGGITGLLRDGAIARAAGYELYLASTLDGPLGIAAALHAAAALGVDRPCGLATLALFEGREDPLAPRDGAIALPAGPGLGDGLSNWYAL
ncbi:MAG: mandelate racemase/muconate lactonizing enzyme family protein [Solirubrobacteraceae bacterium]